jgi:hypothetical protein
MLLADQKDKVIGKDHSLDRRHGIEEALRKKQPDKKEEDADEMLPQNSQNHEASSFQILDCRSQIENSRKRMHVFAFFNFKSEI